MDPFGRTIDYLRISVTDRCNERCLYCMPENYKPWTQRSDHLSADEIVRIAATAADLGFRKFRITGGEPLMRVDVVEIARRIWDIPGVQTLGHTVKTALVAAVGDRDAQVIDVTSKGIHGGWIVMKHGDLSHRRSEKTHRGPHFTRKNQFTLVYS